MRHHSTRSLVLAALFAALTAVGAFLKIPMGISSLSLQFFFTALAGVLLGPKYGALSQAVYVLLGLIGLPIFTAGGGLGYFLQPTCGFLLALIPAAWVIGTLSAGSDHFGRVVGSTLAGLAVLYLIGIPYMYLILNVYLSKGMSLFTVLNVGMFLYLPGDAVKVIVTGLLAKPLLKTLRIMY